MLKVFQYVAIMYFVFIVSTINISASELKVYNDQGVEFTSTDEICANRSYFVETNDSYREIMILDKTTSQVLDVFNSNSNEMEIIFPEDTNNIKIVSTLYTEDGVLDLTTEQEINVSVVNCDYEIVVEPYDRTTVLSFVEYDGENIYLSKPTNMYSDYSLTYQLLDDKLAHTIDFSQEQKVTVNLVENTVVQLTENYTNIDGEIITTFYEIEVNPQTKSFFVRSVNGFEVKKIEKLDVFDMKLLITSLILFVVAIMLHIWYIRVRSQYKNEKIKNQKRG